MMEEDATFPFPVLEIPDEDGPDINSFLEIHDVAAGEVQTEMFAYCGNMGKKTFLGILKCEIPVFSVHPREHTISPDTEPEFVAVGMVFLSHIGIINIPEAIILVKGDEKVPVSDRYITRHGVSSSLKGIRERRVRSFLEAVPFSVSARKKGERMLSPSWCSNIREPSSAFPLQESPPFCLMT
jgi:hypothetical protein